MSVRTDTVNLIVNINGNQAQNKLNDLRKRAVDLTAEMKGLKKSTEEYKAKATDLKQVESAMADLKKQIGTTSLTQKELVAELSKLKALKGSVAPFSTEFKQLSKDIKAVENRLYEVRNGVEGFSGFMSRIKTEVKQFSAIASSYLGVQAIVSFTKKAITEAGKLSDSLADIRRVTGLTKEATNALNESFNKLDTRSSVTSLREIALVAGKLGVEKDSILSFTEALDKLVVALGDELGDANQIAEQLGKIVTVFDGKITGENVTKLGNAFVNLANSGASSATFIADFDQRLSGIAKSANIGLGALSGLGAGLEELGGRVESSSTAVQKIITTIAGDLPTAAKAAGMSVQEFSKLFATDATEAILRFAEGLAKNASSFPEMVKNFKDADEKGVRVIETLSKMGQSADYLRERIGAGTKSIEEFGDINEAFALKNETFGATLDKLGKKLYSLVTSEAVTAFAKGVVSAFSNMLDMLMKLPGWIERNRQALIIMAAGYAVMKAELLANLLLKAQEILLSKTNAAQTIIETAAVKGATAAKLLWSAATALVTGNLVKAKAAMAAFNAILSANVIGAVVIAIGALVAIVDKFSDKAEKARQAASAFYAAQKNLQEISNKVRQSTEQQAATINLLVDRFNKATAGSEAQRAAFEALVKINPAFASAMQNNAINIGAVNAIAKETTANLYRMANAQARVAVRKDLLEQGQKQDIDIANQKEKAVADKKDYSIGNFFGWIGRGFKTEAEVLADKQQERKLTTNRVNQLKAEDAKYFDTLDRRIAYNQERYDKIDAAYKKSGEAVALKKALDADKKEREILFGVTDEEAPANTAGTPFIPGAGTDKKENKKAGKDHKLEQLKKEVEDFYKDLALLRQESDRKGMDADQAELQRVADKYKDLYERAKKLSIDVTAIDEAQANEMAATMEKQAKEKKKAADAKSYDDALQQNEDYHNEWRENLAKAYADGEIKNDEYQKELTAVDLAEQEARWKIAQGYAGYVDKAKKDEVKEHRKYEHEKTQNTIDENERRKKAKDDEKLAKAKTNVLSEVKGSGGELAAKKALLEAQFEIETEGMDKLSEMYKEKEADKNKSIEELDREHLRQRIDQYAQYAQYVGSAIESLMTIANNKGEKELNKEKKRNDEKKKSYKQQLDNKLISETQYNQLVATADEEMDKKSKQLQREQAKREKALRLFSAVISVAQAVATALTAGPGIGIALAIATGIAGALQIAAISSAPLPELGKGDWVRKGDKHKDKSRGIPAMIERDEAVMSAAAMTDDQLLSVVGTTAQITSALNSRRGGASWAGGAKVVEMPTWRTARPTAINSNMPAILAGGGSSLTPDPSPKGEGSFGAQSDNEVLRQILKATQENTEELKNMKTRLHAVVSIKEYEEKKTLYDNAKKVSGL